MATTTMRRWLGHGAAFALAAILSACGGGGGGGDTVAPVTPPPDTTPVSTPAPPPVAPAANVLPIVLDRGTDGSAINSPFVTVTVCEPATANCRTIDHILVDTGSFGLRVNATALGNVALPTVPASNGGALAECAGFASGFTWGSVRTADVRLGGQQASAIPVQVMDDTAPPFATVPTGCSDTGPALPDAGSNGILGVGFAIQDCGNVCAGSRGPTTGVYFGCTATGCTGVSAPLTSQVTNPVAALPTDNNGVAVVLPEVPPSGVQALSGSLVLGIGTRDNNQLGTRSIFNADNLGNFSTSYKNSTLTAFIDSGSNGIFFPDDTLPPCPNGSGFYCPRTPATLGATVVGLKGNTAPVTFTVVNAQNLPFGTVAADLGGRLGSSFDWGLPFFFGRTVFLAFNGRTTPAGAGPFWAF